ncbi:protein CDC73 homolog isoform X1 [Cynara cardunculus var. scolymus]|uniref:RNA polymerase II accessory factor, Cdc73 n=2 Tax=Cynara cardunculus var. scolymus TaxID=59895 RepID=A0A103XKI4_CYNCS|nr:protein CDC73 homolog isoform X1 [Cynara cardunculus var. scolymus]XP_024978749.1 protein CDC73 homolog isoform X1 [Cynara cardunculus var. scolymus]KVH92461.1 RNA polymerase II accessory factor, Cdc73 [Cynara cardunculus var. scolymus]
MDPLTALREMTMRNELDKIVRFDNEYRFGSSYSFPCTIETAYRSKQGNLYTLETLVYFIKNVNVKHHDYIRNAGTQKIPAVTLLDRKPLIEYLEGRISSTDAIEFLPPQPQHQNFENHEYRIGDYPNLNVVPGDELDVENQEPRVGVSENPMDLVRAIERPLKDREMILECRHMDFYSVLTAATKRDEERQRLGSQQRKDGLVAKNRIDRGFGDDLGLLDGAPRPKMHLKGSKIGDGVPIILVPSASQTLITIYNVKEFLEDGVFIPTDVKMKQMKGPKPECVTVMKKFSSRDRVTTAYEVRDKPSALKAEEWGRVVAVFVLGKEWQFKDWPFKDHVEIFNKILGFYMRFEDDSVESAKIVKQWNVKIISISKNKRHQDRAAALDVWDRLEEFVRSRSRS